MRYARVIAETSAWLHDKPGGVKMRTISHGERLQVTGGWKKPGQLIWWPVRYVPGIGKAVDGWMAEGKGAERWLEIEPEEKPHVPPIDHDDFWANEPVPKSDTPGWVWWIVPVATVLMLVWLFASGRLLDF